MLTVTRMPAVDAHAGLSANPIETTVDIPRRWRGDELRNWLLSGMKARKHGGGLFVIDVVVLLASTAAVAATGALTQPGGPTGCISETGAGPCADGHGSRERAPWP
jgi:hypothetical protein